MNDNILIHVISKEEIDFYSRFKMAFQNKRLNTIYVTTSLFCYLLLKIRGDNVYISKKVKKNVLNKTSFFNELVGWTTFEQSLASYNSMHFLTRKIISDNNIIAAFIPSGRLASHEGFVLACRENNIKTIFSGYGNFPNKTFFDSEGTDKASSLFLNISKLDSFNHDEKKFESWKYSYIKQKMESHVVKQARKVTINTYISRFFRILFCKFESIFNIASDISRDFSSLTEFKSLDYQSISSPIPNCEYYFLPLQYSNDAQLILNYEGDIGTSLQDSLTLARAENKILVIKPHPVENSVAVYKLITEFVKSNHDVYLSLDNTFHLISESNKVVTVNSTAGLESKLLNKDVIFLGNSIYKNMTEERIAKYIQSYLLDIEYFELSSISIEDLDKIFRISGVEI
ncbi:capsular polysaccharide export protein, LipB/KpsS family [Photobacterium andalusiense]|uniref:Capsule polysaccharide biosynthesis protein n=1 Tax=Photobacterium andalusiense TaxID=2204296 RepID=A0A1Y6MH56_9GAMM|nr:hypothetical protein [Photobacterium andalusiense]SMY35967.1 Capsule polysaccharide biosynthesis protein [Photobacterium andalusiense]